MKKTNIIYWILTGLISALMLFSAIPDVFSTADAMKFMKDLLGYPAYIVPFLGVAKVLGVIAILIPGYPRIKEWAYAGLFFDLAGATYSIIAVKTPFVQCLPMIAFILLLFGSYFYYHKRLNPAPPLNNLA